MWIGTLVLNLAAIAATVFLVGTHLRNTGTQPDTLSLIIGTPLLLGPYLWMAILALLMRNLQWTSGLTFLGALGLAVVGVWIFFTNTMFVPVPPGMVGDNLTPVVVVMLQWPSTIVLTALALACALWESLRAKRGSHAENA